MSEKAPKRPYEVIEETPYREEVERAVAPKEERRPTEPQQEVQRVHRRPAPEEVQRPKRRPVEGAQYPLDSSAAPQVPHPPSSSPALQNVVPVFDNSIERASLAAHAAFGGPAEQRSLQCTLV